MIDATTGLRLVPHAVSMRRETDALYLTSDVPADPVAGRTLDWLHRWAAEAPDRVFLSERAGASWRDVTYAEALIYVRAIAAALIAREMGPETPIAILSGNSVDHALLSFGAQYAGVPTVPLAEQYSLIPEAHGRLTYVLGKVKPTMAFTDDAGRYAAALKLAQFDGMEVVATATEGASRDVTAFADLLATEVTDAVDARHETVGPDTVAKILFTSGSSSDPKGVLTTQKMMCANQAQMASVLPFLKDRPPRICDWLPWNHVFGGSHNFNMMLANCGTLVIDSGKPTKKAFADTVRNITERPGTLAFNVPVGFSMLVHEMRDNAALREAYFRDLDLIFYAGASLPQEVWTALEDMAREVRGRLPLMISSWGMTETAPATIMLHEPIGRSGVIGVPLPRTEIKLLPDDEMRCELRVKGPNIMPGYYNDPDKTAEALDDEGFLITGDAVRFVDDADPDRGLTFDGRVSEDFKLLTGTWVQAGKLRLDALERLHGLVQDVVICGHDRDAIGLFIIPRPDQVHGDNSSEGAVIDPTLQAEIEERMRDMARAATGSAKRISRAIILAEPPSLKDGEITDKGSLNTRKIITRRAELLERLYDNEDPALIRV
ncbi:feruloyl-CoA synthase [Pseudoponticoccus marisrubri]|uniref:Feruloyl-CoA synthetase n=1 Tax=Pseudoponticoccus marisrubri TaxID=1685382 RepID=A0A0W7WDJ0_9RHOB|nr:feruloyl-CoA synthase [Pseudoponticoccus marisrubri]KUF08720.1 feruloyl-CoA synthetase [Pseudoponticoccus marisrubri]